MKKIKRGASAGGVGRLPVAMVGDSIPDSSLGKILIRWASDAATSTICMCVWLDDYNL